MKTHQQQIDDGSILLKDMTPSEIWNALANSNCRMGEAIPDRVCSSGSGDLSADEQCEQPMVDSNTDEPIS